ncbi:hypothetical protein [Streptomyces wuyuanensis]|uniref:hypothetical protein n=1 Tax=Streptomyces wuyuanensis TaxID=1196353 RepID=UPI00379263D9
MPIEDELGKVLQDTGGMFTADRRALVEGGMARGRRRVARRRAGTVTGSALGVALLTTGAVFLTATGGSPADTASRTPVPSGAYGHFEITAEEIGNILENGMNQTGISVDRPQVESRGSTGPADAATASIVFGDGFGEAKVTLSVTRVDPSNTEVRRLLVCPDKKGSPYEECTNQPGDRAVKGYTEAGKAGGVHKWDVTTLSPNGYLIEVGTQNVQVSGAQSPVGRNPRMNPGKLRHLAMFVDGSLARDGEPNAFGAVEPGTDPEPSDMLPALKYLLPERLNVYSEGASVAEGHVVLSDRTGDLTYVEAVRMSSDFTGGEVLPDGTKVVMRQLPGREPGVVELRVDVLRVNGMEISVGAYNAPSPKSAKRGAKPMVTMEELRAIALSRTWLVAR